MRAPTEPELPRDQRLAFDRAVEHFNRGHYFEAHETLEELWLRLRGPARDFFQALILVSVGFLHLKRGNHTGVTRTFTRALARFEPYPPHYFGFDVAAERERLEHLLHALAAGTAPMPSLRPIWRFEGPRSDAP